MRTIAARVEMLEQQAPKAGKTRRNEVLLSLNYKLGIKIKTDCMSAEDREYVERWAGVLPAEIPHADQDRLNDLWHGYGHVLPGEEEPIDPEARDSDTGEYLIDKRRRELMADLRHRIHGGTRR